MRWQAGSDVCAVANDNAPGQVVVSGTKAAVERAIDIAKSKGAKRAILLDVIVPLHCALMKPAAAIMAEALAKAEYQRTMRFARRQRHRQRRIRPRRHPPRLLVEQVTGVARWRESVEYLKMSSA